MSDSKWSFWKDEAKLTILDEDARTKMWFGVFAGLVLAGIPGLVSTSLGYSQLQSWLLSLLVGLILFPASLARDMFYKGRNAGNKLKDERDKAIAAQNAPVDRRLASIALAQAKRELHQIVLQDIPRRPMQGPKTEMERDTAEFVRSIKRKVDRIITLCDQKTAGTPGAFVGTDGLESVTECSQLADYVDDRISKIEAILETL